MLWLSFHKVREKRTDSCSKVGQKGRVRQSLIPHLGCFEKEGTISRCVRNRTLGLGRGAGTPTRVPRYSSLLPG